MRLVVLSTVCVALVACTSEEVPAVSQQSSSSFVSSLSSSVEVANEPGVVADNLNIPWGVVFLPSGDMLLTERPGTLLRISGSDRTQYPISGVRHIGEGGLLGIALHPNFAENNWVYVYLTTGDEGGTTNRVERYQLQDDQLTNREVILSNLPGARYHDGGAIAFGPDGYLYVTVGDASNSNLAQDTSSLAGKILRITDTGGIPSDNPFGNAVYSYGHRNPQGITWDEGGRMWATEHGRSGVLSGYDELNLIQSGGNYGWPVIEGDEARDGMQTPVLHSGASTTWAPASALSLNGSVFFGGLRGETLYEAILDGDRVLELREYVVGDYGRIRAVTVGPDGMLYITTSNTDGRGQARQGDDKLIRIDPFSL